MMILQKKSHFVRGFLWHQSCQSKTPQQVYWFFSCFVFIFANKLVELLVKQNEDHADNKGSENTRRLHSYLIFATTATTSSGVHFFKDSAFLLHWDSVMMMQGICIDDALNRHTWYCIYDALITITNGHKSYSNLHWSSSNPAVSGCPLSSLDLMH